MCTSMPCENKAKKILVQNEAHLILKKALDLFDPKHVVTLCIKHRKQLSSSGPLGFPND